MPEPTQERSSAQRSQLAGVLMAIGAYLLWGFAVIYFKKVGHISAVDLIAHRVLWSMPFLFGLMLLTGGRDRFRALLADRRAMRLIPLSTVLLAANWFLFVWVVVTNRVLQASLAYFITPLVMVLLGVVLLGERLRRVQGLGLALATAGVALLIVAGGVIPWAALTIAVTWSLYSLVRKIQHAPAIEGLGLEVALLVPASLAWLAWRGFLPEESPNSRALDILLLSMAGVVTAAPLVLFGAALRRIQLNTIGFLQYIAPTFQLALAVLLYDEPFNAWSGVAFGLIWTALIFYTLDTVRKPADRRESDAVTPSETGEVATDADFAVATPGAAPATAPVVHSGAREAPQ
jgi:chloramphenicol-sensitive protein RarD